MRIKLKGSTKTLLFHIQCNGNYRVPQGMIIMHSGVIDTVFHSGDAWHPMP